MSKCTFETECKGNGICCLHSKYIRFCNLVCQLIDRNKTREELEIDVKKCDWFEE